MGDGEIVIDIAHFRIICFPAVFDFFSSETLEVIEDSFLIHFGILVVINAGGGHGTTVFE